MDTDLEFLDMMKMGFFRSEDSEGFIFLKINPLVNRMLSLKGLAPLKVNDELYDSLETSMQERVVRNQQEEAVIRAVRNKDYRQILIKRDDDQEITIKPTIKMSGEIGDKDLLRIIKEKKYQKISVITKNGRRVGLIREETIKA
jgi:hypothetical protein